MFVCDYRNSPVLFSVSCVVEHRASVLSVIYVSLVIKCSYCDSFLYSMFVEAWR